MGDRILLIWKVEFEVWLARSGLIPSYLSTLNPGQILLQPSVNICRTFTGWNAGLCLMAFPAGLGKPGCVICVRAWKGSRWQLRRSQELECRRKWLRFSDTFFHWPELGWPSGFQEHCSEKWLVRVSRHVRTKQGGGAKREMLISVTENSDL